MKSKRPKRGRPPKQAELRRSEAVLTRLTQSELAELQRRSGDLPLAVYMRAKALS